MAVVKQVEIECEVRVITEKALLVYDGKQEVWIAKSQITDETEERGETTSIFIPEWLALEKGLI